MLIITQEGNCLPRSIVNLDNVTSIAQDGPILMAHTVARSSAILGHYSDATQRKQVLDDLVAMYASYMQLNGGPAILRGTSDVQPAIFNIPKVYTMPVATGQQPRADDQGLTDEAAIGYMMLAAKALGLDEETATALQGRMAYEMEYSSEDDAESYYKSVK